MKKIILTLCLTAAIIIGSLGGLSAFAYVSLEDCDRCFQTTISALLDSADVEGTKVSATRKPVYDLTLEQLGYVYEFEISSGSGYTVIICDNGNYVAKEFLTQAQSPYISVGEDELCVYVSEMSYYKAVDGKIFDIQSNQQLSDETVDFLMQNAVFYKTSDPVNPEYVTVTVNFQKRDFDAFDMSIRSPQLHCPGLTGGCAAQAGGNVIGYFDRYYEDLIPNHTAGQTISGYYVYNFGDTYVYSAIRQLYEDMNGTADGISESNFKSGLQKYCSRLGLNCDFTSLMNRNSLDYSAVKASMKADKPVVLFLSTYNICNLETYTEKDYYYYTNFSGNHVMVGFAYRDITYTLSNGSQSNYRMIRVATGFGDPSQAYFNIDYSTNINAAYGAYIH